MPGDKSISHRAALLSALAEGESRIENFLVAGVTNVMLHALADLGVEWNLQGESLVVIGKGLSGLATPKGVLNCGHSATTMRFLLGALAAAGIPATLDGSSSLRRRPMKRVVDLLRDMGIPISADTGGKAPLKLGKHSKDQQINGIEHRLPVASAQVKTAILLAGLAANSPTTIHEPGPSRDHTERLLTSMGVDLSIHDSSEPKIILRTPPRPVLSPLNLSIPGDFSSAAFLIIAALLIPGSKVTIRDLGLNPTRIGLLDALFSMGADIQITNQKHRCGEPVGDMTVRYSPIHATTVEGSLVTRMIDEFPVFAVAAAFARGQTIARDAAELRHKESDRIGSLCSGLAVLGVNIHESPNGFEVSGGNPLGGGELVSGNDHRLAMAFTIAGLVSKKPVVVKDTEIINQSFPGFVSTLQKLGAALRHE
jgi:3-phosphoshikimate 1-carboxyvinyltransferase